MSFKFKLQSVLNYRQSLEDQARQQLSSSLQQQQQLQTEYQQYLQQLQQLDGELKTRQQEGLNIAEIDLFEGQIQHCQRLMHQLQEQLAELERRILRQREELIDASREKQVMEKLKEKQQEDALRELNRKERDMLDEISLRSKGELT